jgi:proline dehydrogenase
MRRILDRARELDTFVRIDMESSAYTQRTLEVHQELWEAGYRDVGTVLQAYLYRTAADVQRAIDMGVPIRLCGAYLEPSRLAYADKGAVDANYARLMEQTLLHGNHPAIATHDQSMVNRAKQIVRRENISSDRFDFEMLFGVRRDLQLQLVSEGYRVRVYVPYGREWYPYLVRRLAERPANIGFFLRALLAEGLAGRRNGHP